MYYLSLDGKFFLNPTMHVSHICHVKTCTNFNNLGAVVWWYDAGLGIERSWFQGPPGALLISLSKKLTCNWFTSPRCKWVPARVVSFSCAKVSAAISGVKRHHREIDRYIPVAQLIDRYQ
jgi:hypothetical protein